MLLRITWRSWIFVALWAAGVALLLWAGGQVDGYRLHVQDVPLPHPYPWSGVLSLGAVALVETGVFYAVLRPESYRDAWGRALSAAAVGAVLLVVFGLGLMHAPPYVFAHWLWLCAATLGFLVLSAASAMRVARRRSQ